MKNLLIYISPTGSFDNPRPDLASNDAGPLAKVQIENSLRLGWREEDILLITNFNFNYGKIKAKVIKDISFFNRKPQASKINTIIRMFDLGLIKKNELYWFHDFDAFQLEPIADTEINISENQIALTDYGAGKYFDKKLRWSTGVIFFKSGSKDIFQNLQKIYYDKKIDEEEALHLLLSQNPGYEARVKKIDNTYNFIGYNLEKVYTKVSKPLKVVHFHPLTGKKRLGGIGISSALRFFRGENPLNIPLITDSVVKLLKYHRLA